MDGRWGHITDEWCSKDNRHGALGVRAPSYIFPTTQRPLSHSPYLLVWASAPKINPMTPVVGLGQGMGGEELLAQFEPWRLRFDCGGSESTLEAQVEPWSLRLIPGGSDEALEAQNDP